MCDVLPNATILRGLNANQLSSMRKLKRRALINQSLRKEISLPHMKVPKLPTQTFDDWNVSFTSVVGWQHSFAGISFDCLLRDEEASNYKANWPTSEENLRSCIKLSGSCFKTGIKSVYSLLVEHIRTTGCGSNLVIKHKHFKDGRRCYIELKSHFHNEAYKQNLVTVADKSLS